VDTADIRGFEEATLYSTNNEPCEVKRVSWLYFWCIAGQGELRRVGMEKMEKMDEDKQGMESCTVLSVPCVLWI